MLSRVSRFVGLAVLIGLLILMVLAGCAKPPEPTAVPTQPPAATAAPTSPPPEPTAVPEKEFEGELTVAIWGQIDADPHHSAYAYHEVLQQWNDLYPKVDLQYEFIGGAGVADKFNWIKTHMAADTLADVVMIYFPGDDYRDANVIYDFTEDLKKPNPYSSNATWFDDFPYGLIFDEYVGPNGELFFVGPTQYGDTGVTCIVYNKDIFDEVGATVPETWAEFLEIQQKIKDAGYTPFFQPTAGPMGWLVGWPIDTLTDQLMDEVIKECDFEAPEDVIMVKEMAWAVKTGAFRTDDPRFMESWKLMKEWSQYWQEGFLAPPPEGDPFVQGEAAMQWTMNFWIGSIAANPEITFEWGTFYMPQLTKDSTEYDAANIRRMGSHGAAGSGSQFLMIPLTTVERGKLDMALDFCQYTTAPEQLEYWCERQPIPCFEPGTSIEEVYPDDPQQWVQMLGFFDPGAYKNGIREFRWTTFGFDAETLATKLLQEYLGDAISLEDAMAELQAIAEEETDKAIREHPEWDTSSW